MEQELRYHIYIGERLLCSFLIVSDRDYVLEKFMGGSEAPYVAVDD